MILCKLWVFQWQKGTWSPICIFLSPPFFPLLFFYLLQTWHSFYGTSSSYQGMASKEALLAAFGCGGAEARGTRRMWADEESPSVFFHFDVLRNTMPRVVALNRQGLVSTSETKAVIAIQWQPELLHVQPNPISLAWKRNGVWQVIPWLFLFILSSVLIIQYIW